MRHGRSFVPLLWIPALVLLLALPAWARGGRYAGPRAAPSSATSETEAEPAPEPACPDPESTEAPQPPSPPAQNVTLPEGNGGIGRRRGLVPQLGVTDWLYWYEANREPFEDLRAAWLLTETNPLFSVGGAVGPKVGTVTARIGENLRTKVVDVLERVLEPEQAHWIYTEAAALVALGKVAAGQRHLAAHFAALETPRAAPAYLQESAVLGLAHLARTDRDHRLGSQTLDRARGLLLLVLENGEYGITTRAFAGLALGVLADQPSVRKAECPKWTADRLFKTWITNDLPDEVQVGILLGLSRVDGDAVPRVVKLVLEGCALRGREWAQPASSLVRAQALLTLAHVGDGSNAHALVSLLTRKRGVNASLLQAAAIAAGVLGSRGEVARDRLAPAVLAATGHTAEPGARHLAWIALGRLLEAELASGGDRLLEDEGYGDRLLQAARKAPLEERAFAQIACALAARNVDHTVESGTWQRFRFDAVEVLRRGVDDTARNAHARAACCLSLGLILDRPFGGRLLELLRDERLDPELRAYAALGLGLLGDARKGVVPALVKAIERPRSELLRMRAATALGLLGARGVEDRGKVIRTLVTAMRSTRSQALQGQIAITLGRLGDPKAVDALIETVEASAQAHQTRALATAALGLLADEEITPVLSATRQDAHYMASSTVLREILDLL